MLWSRNPKQVKMSKYQDLASTCRDNGWKSWIFLVEVSCRGFPSWSTRQTLIALGIKDQAQKAAIHALDRSAEKASSWLWLQHGKPGWQPTEMGLKLITPPAPTIPRVLRVRRQNTWRWWYWWHMRKQFFRTVFHYAPDYCWTYLYLQTLPTHFRIFHISIYN